MSVSDYIRANTEYFCEKTGYSNVVYTNGASSALHAFLLTQKFDQGDEIIFPVECYPTLPMVAMQCGLKPVFADTDECYNLSPEDLRNKLTKRTRFVIVIHMAGVPAKMQEIVQCLKGREDITLIEDWCQAFGTILKGGLKKNDRTKAAILSFSSSKLLSIDGGGLCLLDSEEDKEKMECIINNGYHPQKRFIMFGYTYYMHKKQYELLYHKIKDLDQIIENHDRMFENMYNKLLKEFVPVCKRDDKILQHKIVTQVAMKDLDFGKVGDDPFYKDNFQIGEYHYPVDIFNEEFIKDYTLQAGVSLKDYPNFAKNKKTYLAFRVQENITDYVSFMKQIIKKYK